ncbi:MAG TPA: heme ABC exporter ATP-binding protein CcmA [Polyangiaceae bacterium LLY-WYZ-15_(1-7)]|nr:heme ABC exporter ATP-binding protein CcmA [Myxococcales bacterium]MAT29734.1 heme ABC exporter ATP-binding protein CcmA [Sandaracinus sp.]HJK91412.1 heme ABC exporter ATP-binding protein CcmA [Polyangiaceae bacterium LLY-WYZ-15_(1-7)]MBJ75326.1 heme ABC exporter ATP-binding protein CcmA [Sandaracinus sp.]HJL04993.1 heme ABC exporter ATP-binding protein CcmA [Polyangiaceae bacterium LLY-WYZ-15_(1-7)]
MSRAFDTVRARGLVKLYGRTRALAGVDLTLEAGRVTVVEGPNGSGKSTLLHLLALLAQPTDGELRFGELRAPKQARRIRRHVGVLTHASMLYPDLDGAENLQFYAELHGLPHPAARVKELRERFDIGPFGERPVRTYSRGQLQRVALARALVAEPDLLLLDEPSTGLDVAGVARLVEVVKEERARGAIVALITHDRELADQVADARLRLRRGRVQKDGEAA